ncbi:MAG: hypothetical protein FJ271_25760 [Planctomycetes bacterium]|nr:hypothetical protein [Planctomycetota bacterium]
MTRLKSLLLASVAALAGLAVVAPWAPAQPEAKPPRITLVFHREADKAVPSASMRFGIIVPGDKKRLTFDPMGRSSNTCLKIDGNERLLGTAPGQWLTKEAKLGADPAGRERIGLRSTWLYPDEKVEVTQTVEIAQGQQTFDVDTCWIRYTIENKDDREHKVGLRFLLDTLIGTNDGAPYIVPGESSLCETFREYQSADKAPEFVQALESLDFKKPGVVAHLKLKLGGALEPPDRALLTSWPDPRLKLPNALGTNTLWAVPTVPITKTKDSAAVLYWNEKELPAGGKRELGFTYGLGNFSANAAGDLGIVLGGAFKAGTDVTVLALVKNPPAGQTLTLRHTEGLERVGGAETLPVPAASGVSKVSPVTWKVRATKAGTYCVGIESSNGSFHHQGVKIGK